MFTNGSRLGDGATGYAAVWKNGQSWVGIRTHVGYNQEAYDAECAALARALETASRRQTTPERVTVFTDAQAAVRRMASEETGSGQMYVLRARKHISVLGQAGYHHQDPVAFGTQGSPREREGRRTGQARGRGDRHARGRMAEIRTDQGCAHCRCPDRSHTSSGRSRGRNEWRRGGGLEAGPLRRNIRCRRARGSAARLRVVLRGSPQGSTNSRPVTAYPGSTYNGRRTTPRPSAGGAGVRSRRGTTSSRCVPSGRASRRYCGRR